MKFKTRLIDRSAAKQNKMPDNTAANTAAAAELLGQSVNAWSAANTNKKQRQWQEKMYGQQRIDALADWTMQNEYNSPAQQMARLKAAGLNPALIYGSGTASAMSSSQPRASSPGSWNPKVPEVQPSQAVVGYYNQKMQEAAIRNMDTKNTVLLADAALKAGSLDKLRTDTMKGKTEIKSIEQLTGQRQMLLPVLMEQIKANIARMGAQQGVLESDKALKDQEKLKVIADTAKSVEEKRVMTRRLELEVMQTSQNIRESVQRILNLRQQEAGGETEQNKNRAQIKLTEVETRIKQLDEQFLREGHRPGDKWFIRQVEDIIRSLERGAKPNVREYR